LEKKENNSMSSSSSVGRQLNTLLRCSGGQREAGYSKSIAGNCGYAIPWLESWGSRAATTLDRVYCGTVEVLDGPAALSDLELVVELRNEFIVAGL
jgi:hypothetical protein